MTYQNTKHKEFKEAIEAMKENDPPLQWSIPSDIKARSFQTIAHHTARVLGYKIFANIYKNHLYIVRVEK